MAFENLLAELNAFRAAEGKAPFADWRKARHMPMLEAYRAAAFEAPADELAAQQGRPSTEEVEGTDTHGEEAPEEVAPAAHQANAEDVPAKEKAPAYKDFANYDRSSVLKPVEFVHQFLDAHPELSRKAAVQALVEAGVNYSTARTQYQRWFTKKKGA